LSEPANLGYIKNVLGLTELVIPGEDSRNKQLREIQVLLGSAPIVVAGENRKSKLENRNSEEGSESDLQPAPIVLPSVAVDVLLDNHAVEFEECKRWANSEAGQSAKMTNPVGFANVRAHAEAHLRVMQASQSWERLQGARYRRSSETFPDLPASKKVGGGLGILRGLIAHNRS